MENLTANAIALCTPWEVHSTVRIMKRYWSRKKCGWAKCRECDHHNDDKQAAYDAAAELFRKTWERMKMQGLPTSIWLHKM